MGKSTQMIKGIPRFVDSSYLRIEKKGVQFKQLV